MRRDPDLERKILLAIEAYDPDEHPDIEAIIPLTHQPREMVAGGLGA